MFCGVMEQTSTAFFFGRPTGFLSGNTVIRWLVASFQFHRNHTATGILIKLYTWRSDNLMKVWHIYINGTYL
jgi:hypothetical protein